MNDSRGPRTCSDDAISSGRRRVRHFCLFIIYDGRIEFEMVEIKALPV